LKMNLDHQFIINMLKKLSTNVGSKILRLPAKPLATSPQVFKNTQFNQNMLVDYGDIPLGEIPEPLKYDRPYEITTISNGIKVMTEPSMSEVAAVGVFIGAGSRHEKMENSGEAHFLEHLHFKGTTRRSRYGLETEVENRGNQLNAYTSREFTLYHMLAFKSDVP
jgi:hypothetical protein